MKHRPRLSRMGAVVSRTYRTKRKGFPARTQPGNVTVTSVFSSPSCLVVATAVLLFATGALLLDATGALLLDATGAKRR